MHSDTLPRLLVERAVATAQQVAMREKDRGIWQEMTWAAYLDHVKQFSLGLRALGLERGDKVAIIGDNRPEWFIAELAAQAAGAASVGLFQDANAREIQHIVDHSDARFVVVEDQEQVDKLLEIKAQLPRLETIVYYDAKGLRHYNQPYLIDFVDVEQHGRAFEKTHPGAFEERLKEGRADDVAVLCYTSGTTGDPKAAMLSHANLLAAVDNLTAIDPIRAGDEYLSFLPCGWIAEQTLGLTAALRTGLVVNFPEAPETVQDNLREIGPSVMLAAPRIWENLVSQVTVKTQDASWLKRHIVAWGLRVGYAVVDLLGIQEPIPIGLHLQHAIAERLVFFPLRDQLGLRKLTRAYTGGAPLGPDAFRFFRALGVNLKQVYGQTEIGGLSAVHRDGRVDGETVGQALPNIDIRISDQGEILSRGPSLFMGYYKNPEATLTTVRDGWLHSGDAGLIDEYGELIVLDRLKDVMQLADGRRFAPQYIENKLKFSPYVKEAVALGQHRPFVAAIVNIDMANVGKWAETHGVAYTTYTDLAQKPEVYDLIAADVRRANAVLPLAARINRFVLLHKELDADDDEMTRTRKVRRRVIAERYADIIAALYDPTAHHVFVDTEVQYQDGRRARIEANLHLFTVDAKGADLSGLPVAA
jgi:long-chain acyl-CoA synthetase